MAYASLTIPTPVGDFHLVLDGATVCASGFGALNYLIARLPDEPEPEEVTALTSPHPYHQAVEAYFAGNTKALDTIPREQPGSPFQQSVWQAMSRVPYGKTISYAELATRSGNHRAVRAVGTTCGENRLCLLVPCHRIIRSDGSIGHYLYGEKIKQFLLDHEQKTSH